MFASGRSHVFGDSPNARPLFKHTFLPQRWQNGLHADAHKL